MGIRSERRPGYPTLIIGANDTVPVADSTQPDGVRWASRRVIGQYQPTDHGLISWAFDPACIVANGIPTSGVQSLIRLPIDEATTITNIALGIITAGATLTSGQCFASLYQGGNLLASTADQSAAWVSTGAKIMALTAPQAVVAGFVYVGLYSNGTTNPAFGRGPSNPIANVGFGSNYRFAQNPTTGLTTTPPSTTGTVTASNNTFWAGVS